MATTQQQRKPRSYGFPFRGCKSTVDRHEVPIGYCGPDSHDLLVEPGRDEAIGKLKRRHGAASLGANTGVLELAPADATMRGLQLADTPTDSSNLFKSVPAVLFADESKHMAQMFYHDNTTDIVEGADFGASHYTGRTSMLFVAPPIPCNGNGATLYNRYAFADNRARVIAGSRNKAGIKNRDYFGGFDSAATNSNRKYNPTTVSGSSVFVRFPTGLVMPLREAVRVDADYPTVGALGQWRVGDQYYEAWGFEWEDGTRSMPLIPREPQGAGSTLAAGFALVTVGKAADAGAASPNDCYAYVPDRQVRIGGPGVRKRLKYRTAKISKAAAAAGGIPDLTTLALCGIIEDNTTTTYNDYKGNDTVLLTDPLTRRDQIWQPRARYEWAFDQRKACAYLRPSPYAIVLAPTGDVAAGDINFAAPIENSISWPSAVFWMVQLRQDSAGALTLRLRRTAGGAPTNTAISLAGTLQDVVDLICATTIAGAGKEWRAQLVPGTGALIPATALAPTHIDSAGGTWLINSPTLNLTNATDIAEGMKVNDPKWPANTYVKVKTNNTLTMSANSTAAQAVAADVEFYCDTGDDSAFVDATAHSQFGNAITIGNSVPFILAFKESYLAAFPTEKRDFMITAGGPTDRPYGANLYHSSPGCRRTVESDAGIFMGGAPLKRGCIIFCSNWIGYCVNTSTSASGADADYRVIWLDKGHGCKSPYSIVFGNNWAGCWRDDGFWITDGEDSVVISRDHFAVTTLGGVGEFAYEAGLCNASAAADSNDCYMHSHYADGRLWLNYRVSAGVFANACYDASASVRKSGLAQMLDDQGRPFGWSPRCSYSWRSASAGCGGAIGSVRRSDGIHLYQCDDKNDKAKCGLLQEFETTGAYLDGADPVVWDYYGPQDMAGGLQKSCIAGPLTLLYKNTVSSGASGVTGTIYRDQARAASSTIAVPTTPAGTFFTRKPINTPLATRSPSELIELRLHGGALSTEQIFEISGAEFPVDVLDLVT